MDIYALLPPLTPEHLDALRASIKEHGVSSPILVDQCGEVIDGFARLAICEELKRECPRIVQNFAHEFRVDDPFDGLFSNAALHWIKKPEKVAACLSGALKANGRMAVEFGGHGNVHHLSTATRRELQSYSVNVNLEDDLPLVFVDGLLMEQVLVNLLENATRYTPPGTQISVTAIVAGQSLKLTVADNGPGIPPGAEERIFEKFYRAFPTADAGRGSGLGLAICRAIAKAHGGNVTARNRPEGGAEFIVKLPLAKDAPEVVVE